MKMLNRKGEGKNKSTFQDEGLRTIGTGGQRWRELLPDTRHTRLWAAPAGTLSWAGFGCVCSTCGYYVKCCSSSREIRLVLRVCHFLRRTSFSGLVHAPASRPATAAAQLSLLLLLLLLSLSRPPTAQRECGSFLSFFLCLFVRATKQRTHNIHLDERTNSNSRDQSFMRLGGNERPEQQRRKLPRNSWPIPFHFHLTQMFYDGELASDTSDR